MMEVTKKEKEELARHRLHFIAAVEYVLGLEDDMIREEITKLGNHHNVDMQAKWCDVLPPLPFRARTCLVKQGIDTIGQLLRCNYQELLDMSNIGMGTVRSINNALTEAGFMWRGFNDSA